MGMTGHAPQSRPSADPAQDAHAAICPEATRPRPYTLTHSLTHYTTSHAQPCQPYCGLALSCRGISCCSPGHSGPRARRWDAGFGLRPDDGAAGTWARWRQSLGPAYLGSKTALGQWYAVLRGTSAGETDISLSALAWAGLAVAVSSSHKPTSAAPSCTGLAWRLPGQQSACHCLIVSPDSGWPRRVALGTVARGHAAAARWSFSLPGHGRLRRPRGLHVKPCVLPAIQSPTPLGMNRRCIEDGRRNPKSKDKKPATTKARRHGTDLQSRGSVLLA